MLAPNASDENTQYRCVSCLFVYWYSVYCICRIVLLVCIIFVEETTLVMCIFNVVRGSDRMGSLGGVEGMGYS